MTYSDRIALLEKARKAKADKRAGLNKMPEPEPEPEPEPAVLAPPKKPRPKSVKPKQPPKGRTLELPAESAPLSDEEVEIEERVIYRPKPEKKKKIIRTIIKDHSSDDEEEEIHETVEQPPKPKKQISNKQPKLCPSKSSYFCY